MTAEKIATLISRPESVFFFEKNTGEKLEIGCKYDWISQNISQKVNFRGGEIEILENILETKFAEHVNEYWTENGKITRDLESRSIGEWIENEICFLAGFALWFREKEKEGEKKELKKH